ncbi:MAG: polysaccharide deacetylase family protein [Candidatus Lokiarchaeota archaeon]|nr:polysaccharide deacetylase family protein [Candidatus Lokiarchaeota archaeon]
MKIVLTFDIERDIPRVFNSYLGVKIGLLKILKILDEFNIKGTFFCTGDIIEHLPEYVKLIERKDHEIGCHSLNHERLNQLDFNKCYELIYKNKKLLENLCQHSEIIGFRAPYLKPPLFLPKILANLGFKYDSSISSQRNLKKYQIDNSKIYEFPPSNFNVFFRLPVNIRFLSKWIFRKNLTILYFHPWEAINMKALIFNQTNLFIKYKNLIIRPDRWVNTGDLFINRLRDFIKEALSKKIEIVTLKNLIIDKEKTLT